MRAILSVLVALSVAGPGASESARAVRSGAGLPIGRRSDGSRRHGRRRERACRCAICACRNSPSPSTGSRAASSARNSSPTARRRLANPPKPRDPYVSNNTDRRPGRLIMLVIDRNNIDTHTVRERCRVRSRSSSAASRPMTGCRSSRFRRRDHLSISRPTTRRCSTPSRASSGRRTTDAFAGSTSATTRPSRSRIVRTPLRRSGCCFARAAIPTRTRCRRAIATSSRRR